MRKYTSPPQVYTSRPGAGFVSSLYTFPHDLGVMPDIVKVFLECIIPDQGYAVGAIVPVGPHSVDRIITSGIPGDYASTGFTIKQTATDILMSVDTTQGASIHQFDLKKNGRPHNGAWKIVVKAYAP